MSNIREEMPVLARHEGEWFGSYILIAVEVDAARITHKLLRSLKNTDVHVIATDEGS
ncbi:MAG TPA: hypothetical protein V6D10_15080 [Trichocoleus sp.]|jgi:hypothetical protein